MIAVFPSWRACIVGGLLGAVLLSCGSGCTPTAPATKVPSTKNSGGDLEQLPTPPKRDPG
jgi:hypothetical protein